MDTNAARPCEKNSKAILFRPGQCGVAERSLNTGLSQTWGMGLHGVVVCLASRISDGFNSHILHCVLVVQWLVRRLAKANIRVRFPFRTPYRQVRELV